MFGWLNVVTGEKNSSLLSDLPSLLHGVSLVCVIVDAWCVVTVELVRLGGSTHRQGDGWSSHWERQPTSHPLGVRWSHLSVAPGGALLFGSLVLPWFALLGEVVVGHPLVPVEFLRSHLRGESWCLPTCSVGSSHHLGDSPTWCAWRFGQPHGALVGR